MAGCGGDDEEGRSEKGSGGSGSSTPAKADSPSHATVLKCLKDEGLEAKDQTSSFGKTIGIDYPGGRLVISFQESVEDAETYASAAKTSGEATVVKGSIVATIPVDAEAQTAEEMVKGCI